MITNDTIYRYHYHSLIPAKQFIKNKVNPVKIKNFAIFEKLRKAHDFELYQGKGGGDFPKTWKISIGEF